MRLEAIRYAHSGMPGRNLRSLSGIPLIIVSLDKIRPFGYAGKKSPLSFRHSSHLLLYLWIRYAHSGMPERNLRSLSGIPLIYYCIFG